MNAFIFSKNKKKEEKYTKTLFPIFIKKAFGNYLNQQQQPQPHEVSARDFEQKIVIN